MKRALSLLLAAAALAGCGGDTPVVEDQDAAAGQVPLEPTPEPGFDPMDPALQTIPETSGHAAGIIRKAGKRRDFKVPVSAVAGLKPGPLVRAVVLRPFHELAEDESGLRRLNAGQRAVYAMYLADFEILNGGFWQFWFNASGGIANDLLPAAERVGSPEFAAIFRDAAALWPGEKVPADRARRNALLETFDEDRLAELDARYAPRSTSARPRSRTSWRPTSAPIPTSSSRTDMGRLERKVLIVTGATRGIGLATRNGSAPKAPAWS